MRFLVKIKILNFYMIFQYLKNNYLKNFKNKNLNKNLHLNLK